MDLDSKLRPVAEALLTQGEELRGVCIATRVGLFKGRQVLLGVTDGRLLVHGMNRKFEPVGDAPPAPWADASAIRSGGNDISAAAKHSATASRRSPPGSPSTAGSTYRPR